MNMLRSILLALFIVFTGNLYGQLLIPFAFTSEEDNRLIKENDSFKYYVASGDTMNTVCINDETSFYKLLNKDLKIIAAGYFVTDGDKYLQDGKWETFFGSGKVKLAGYFQKGIPIGTWEEYHANGKIRMISNYGIFIQNNEMSSCMSGTFQEFYSSGKIKVNGFYGASFITAHDTVTVTDPVTGQDVIKVTDQKALRGAKTGHWEYFDENGEIEKKEDH